MVNLDKPFTYENSSDPWLKDPSDKGLVEKIISLQGHKVLASWLWTLSTEEREQALQGVFNYYRERESFPYEELSEDYIREEFSKLKSFDSSKVLKDGFLSNSGSLCLDVCRYFCRDLFYKARGESGSVSEEDVFFDDDKFMRVLKNRMGWNTTKEGGKERPYMFGISDAMIRTGIKNSGFGYGVSNFRPSVAKFAYDRYLGIGSAKRVFDYSAGWGARALAALAGGYEYAGVDPLTSRDVQSIIRFFGDTESFCLDRESQDQSLAEEIGHADLAFSCPPYFTLERYSEDSRQCYNKFSNYKDWLELYWRPTVKNCWKILDKGQLLVFVVKDKHDSFSLKEDMQAAVESEGFKLEEDLQYKTSRSHLSGKAKTGVCTKSSEHMIAYTRQ